VVEIKVENLSIKPLAFQCDKFMDSPDSEERQTNVIIAPIRFTTNERGSTLKVAYACNLGTRCHNPLCFYVRMEG